jgi:hypothetical protein
VTTRVERQQQVVKFPPLTSNLAIQPYQPAEFRPKGNSARQKVTEKECDYFILKAKPFAASALDWRILLSHVTIRLQTHAFVKELNSAPRRPRTEIGKGYYSVPARAGCKSAISLRASCEK